MVPAASTWRPGAPDRERAGRLLLCASGPFAMPPRRGGGMEMGLLGAGGAST
jgi:hypothetical protein